MKNLLGMVFGEGFNGLYIIIAAAVIFGAGASSGWELNGWRLGAEIERQAGQVKTLTVTNSALENANKQCGIDVEQVTGAVNKVLADSQRLTAAALAAMGKAQASADSHLARADRILKAAAVPNELAAQCAAIIKEQRDYVDERRAAKGKP